MKIYVKYVECADCGRKIPVCNAHYINGKPYGYSCYLKQLALIQKQLEDEKNYEYYAECFAAMQVFERKKSNSFHDFICKQWNECKKLTVKQLQCIINGFTNTEQVDFYIAWNLVTKDECTKRSIPLLLEDVIYKNKNGFADYMENDAVISCLLHGYRYRKYGFCFYRDAKIEEDSNRVIIIAIDKDGETLKELKDECYEIIKVVQGIHKI